MELKLPSVHSQPLRYAVQIVPLWNWNRSLKVSNNWAFTVQIVPLWNWNLHTMPDWGQLTGFKLYLYGIEIVLIQFSLNTRQVQIVPLWNWNSRIGFRIEFLKSSNCTFMELKYETKGENKQMQKSSNCTFMELK